MLLSIFLAAGLIVLGSCQEAPGISNLTVTFFNDKAKMTWNSTFKQISGYDIRYRKNSQSTELGETTETQFTLQMPHEEGIYEFFVDARLGDLYLQSIYLKRDYKILGKPRILESRVNNDGSLMVKWSRPNAAHNIKVIGYRVEITQNNTLIDNYSFTPKELWFTYKPFKNGFYNFTVQAEYENGQVGVSDMREVHIAPPLTNLTVKFQNGEALVSWNSTIIPKYGYIITWIALEKADSLSVRSNTTRCTLKMPYEGTFQFRVEAKIGKGTRNPSIFLEYTYKGEKESQSLWIIVFPALLMTHHRYFIFL